MHATRRGIAGSMDAQEKHEGKRETCQIAHAPVTSSEGEKRKQYDRPGLYDTAGLALRGKLESQWVCHRQFIPCKKIGGLGDKAIITRHPMRSTASHHISRAKLPPFFLHTTETRYASRFGHVRSLRTKAAVLHSHRPVSVPVTVQSCG